MKDFRFTMLTALLLLGVVALSSCNGKEREVEVPQIDPPQLVQTTPENGATDVDGTFLDVKFLFDQNVFFPSSRHSNVSIDGGAKVASIKHQGKEVTIRIENLQEAKSYTLQIPKGTIEGPTKVSAEAIAFRFSTTQPPQQLIKESLVDEKATKETRDLYNFFREAYGKQIVSGIMAKVNWNTEYAAWVLKEVGYTPKINTFDFVHLFASGADSWINYSDITPVKEWHQKGGIVSLMWHWNVPVDDPQKLEKIEYAFYAKGKGGEGHNGTVFDPRQVFVENSWEKMVFYDDLRTLADHLLLLQEEGIAVLWRPFHEAAGGWFWWGTADGATFKKLWQAMYHYLTQAGVHNLIWVWTSEGTDTDWYPGDEYVDMIGRDLYHKKNVQEVVREFRQLSKQYPYHMLALSECGDVANVSQMWEASAKWSWVMPWYPGNMESNPEEHATLTWWKDLFAQPYVVRME